jgi:hypothetical protein
MDVFAEGVAGSMDYVTKFAGIIQGDQIKRIFAVGGLFTFASIFENYRCSLNFWSTF